MRCGAYISYLSKDLARRRNVLSMNDQKEPDRQGRETRIGAGVAIGVGIGTALFAALDNPVWIGVGVAIGAGVGAAMHGGRNGD